MICRRCDKGIPDGSVTCPRCGISQGRYMSRQPTAITTAPRSWFTDPKALMSVFGVVMLMAISIYFGRDYQKNQHFDGIIDAYQACLEIENDTSIDSVDRQLILDRLAYRGTRFIERYPDDPRIDEIHSMIMDTQNLIAEDEYEQLMREFLAQQERDHEEYFNYLRANARHTVFSIAAMTPAGPSADGRFGFAITWHNRSVKTIEEISFYVEGFNGDEAIPTATGGARVKGTVSTRRPPGYRTVSQWLRVWDEPVTQLVLRGVHIKYDDGTYITLPEEIITTVWD